MQKLIAVVVVGLTVLVFAATAQTKAVYQSQHHSYRVEMLFQELNHPWGLAFLPDGRMLVTEQAGRLNLLNPLKGSRKVINGIPPVAAAGQGGLLDVALHPDFESNRFVYLSYTAAGDGGYAVQVGRGRLQRRNLKDFEVLFTAIPFTSGEMHFGSRLAFDRAGYLYVTVGDRREANRAQELDSYHGSVVRLTGDGKFPSDNPFIDRAGALPGIWSYGHRNPQGLTVHPETGVLWLHEHGPRGGDELNLPKRGANHGWPKATFGMDYRSGEPIGSEPPVDGMEPPIHHWTPAIAPSGMAFYDGDAFPNWRGDLLVGSLVQHKLVRLRLEGERVVEEEDLLKELGWRIRDVRIGPDGYLYLLPDTWGAQVIRLMPADSLL
jgi:aldose sugar dehydrogenase